MKRAHHDHPHEGVPLVLRHISMEAEVESEHEHPVKRTLMRCWKEKILPSRNYLLLATIVVLVLSVILHRKPKPIVVTIENAEEHMLDIGEGLSLWYRTWGNRLGGVPVLFVHGGPGNCIADYHNGNARFFDAKRFFVIEVDQRGTGKSQPSVREDCKNMKYYKDISIDKMSHDYEMIRRALKIDKWLVFGGSWGSTLSLDYAERYTERCLGLILRGIWLNTLPEFDAIFTRKSYTNNTKHLAEFDTWFELAKEAEPSLDPNDGEQFFRIYGRMIQQCNKDAIWRHFVFENNLMEEDPNDLLDPFTIEMKRFGEASSVAFFENRLFLYGTFDDPMDLLDQHRVGQLSTVKTWICQGIYDKVCPAKYARKLADALKAEHAPLNARFVNANHEDTEPLLAECLKESVAEFLASI